MNDDDTNDQQQQEISVADRIELVKKRRRNREAQRFKSLGESSDEDDDAAVIEDQDEPKRKKPKNDTLSWIEKSRKLERERKLAEQRDKELLELETAATATNDYTSKDLKGMKISHDQNQFGSDEVILTLKDKGVLDEDDDELENINMIETERKSWLKKQSQHKNKIAEAVESYEKQEDDEILPHYKDEIDEKFKAKNSFTLAGDDDAQARLARLRAKLKKPTDQQQAQPEIVYSIGESETRTIATDYMTKEEAEKKTTIKKRKSKRKKRSRDTTDSEEPTPVTATIDLTPINTDGRKDHGSRSDNSYHKRQEEEQLQKQRENLRAYEMGVTKAMEHSKVLYANAVDDEEVLLPNIQNRQARKRAEDAVTEALVLYENMPEQIVPSENTVIFNATEEFAKHIELKREEDEETKPRIVQIKHEEPEQMDIEPEANITTVIKRRSNRGSVRDSRSDDNDNTFVAPVVQPQVKQEEETKHVEVISEPIIASGTAAALQFAQQKGLISELEYAGRRKDQRVNNLKHGALHNDTVDDDDITIEYRDKYGRIMTPKQVYREMSHKYHGEGPGKNKLEKERRRYLQEMKMKQMSDTDTPLRAMEALERVQTATNLPYVVMDQNNLSVIASAHSEQQKEASTSNSGPSSNSAIHSSDNATRTQQTSMNKKKKFVPTNVRKNK
jgi:U4/U6.U5 tri-snRNP-associated protein 1